MRTPIVKDEDCHTYKYSEAEIIKKQIDKEKHKFLKRREYIEMNIDYRSNRPIDSEEKKELLKRITKDYYDYLLKMDNNLPNFKFSMDENEYERVSYIIENEINYAKKFKIKNKKLHAIVKKTVLALSLAGAIVGTPIVSNKLEQNRIFSEKTGSYEDELDKAVATSIHEKYGNKEYVNGELIYVTDNQSSSKYVKYIDYDLIADCIKNSDNPDLMLYLLYKNYGTQKGTPLFNKITSYTCKRLEFTNGEDVFESSFKEYVKKNGYNNYKEYDKACKKEICDDNDNILDNLSINVKKNSLSLKRND